MDGINLQTAAGFLSTTIFIGSALPMLAKAAKTRDLKSYSFANITLSNAGNLVHWLYISQFPFGPIWLLHAFYTITMICMLVWYLRYGGLTAVRQQLPTPFTARSRPASLCGCS
jgi:hypothetical protein